MHYFHIWLAIEMAIALFIPDEFIFNSDADNIVCNMTTQVAYAIYRKSIRSGSQHSFNWFMIIIDERSHTHTLTQTVDI